MAEDAAPAVATPPLRMVAVDMDGTLLRPDGTVSERTVTVLRDIASRGTIVCVASGRPAPTIRRYARQLDIGPLPAVCFNGACAMLLDGDEGRGGGGGSAAEASDAQRSEPGGGGGDRVWFASTLDVGVVSAVLNLAAELDLPVQYCLPDKSLTSPVGRKQTELVQFFDELVGPEGWSVKVPSLAPKTTAPEADASSLPSSSSSSLAVAPAAASAGGAGGTWPGPLPPPLKLIVVTGSQSRADEVASHARQVLTPDECHVIAAEVHVEFLMPRVNKASGLTHVCDAMGVSLDQVVAFGDANNDVEMLEACGMSYAMPNGREAALAAAHRRCRFDNAADGVAVELETLLAEGALVGGDKINEEEEGVGKRKETQGASARATDAPVR